MILTNNNSDMVKDEDCTIAIRICRDNMRVIRYVNTYLRNRYFACCNRTYT